jgi:anti-sigma regulatory factor (Ser/Thr protein kinase)
VHGSESAAPRGGSRSYVHEVTFPESAEDLAAVAVPFLQAGLDAGDAAVVAVSDRTGALLHDALGTDDDRVVVLPPRGVYRRRTPSALTEFRRLATERTAAGFRGMRVVAETQFGTLPREWQEWERYESVVNVALAGLPVWGLCVYDPQRLPDQVLESGLASHPWVRTADGPTANPAFVAPADYLRTLPVPAEPLEDTPPLLALDDVRDYVALRHTVAGTLATLTGSRDLREDFLLAIDEMASNAVRHGGPPVSLRLWATPDRAVCRITDSGAGLDDPFAGYGPAHGEDLSRGGMGLWLARQLCDHVDVLPERPGVTVRLTVALR